MYGRGRRKNERLSTQGKFLSLAEEEQAQERSSVIPRRKRGETLLGSGAIYALASVAPILATLLITPIVTRLLGPTEYGVVGISITLYQVGSVALSLGLPAAVTRHAIIARSGERGAASLVIIGSGIAVGLGLFVAALIPLWGSAVLGSSMQWILLCPIISSIGLSMLTLSQSFLRAVERVVVFVTLSGIAALLGPTSGFVSALVFGPSPAAYLGGMAGAHLLVGAVSLVVVVRHARPQFSRSETRENLRIGLPTLPHSIAISFLISALVVLASKLGGFEEAGRLQLALLLGTAPIILLGAFNNSWAPMIYRASNEDRAPLLASSLRAIAVLVFVLVGGFCVLAQPVVSFIAGPKLYSPELLVAALIVTAATPLMALYLANIHLVMLSGRTTLIALSTPLSLVISLLAVAGITRVFGVDSLVVYAVGYPIFHLSQWMMSSFLARRSGYAPPRVLGALPVLAAAFLTSILVAVLRPSLWLTACIFVVAVVAIVYKNRSVLGVNGRKVVSG